ncbi:MAG: flagellar export protein FliJ [Acidobacteriota bacterium]
MKVFEFRLQTKLEITERQEDIAKAELFEKQMIYDEALAQLNELCDSMEELNNTLRGKTGHRLHIDDIIVLKQYQLVLKDRIIEQEAVVAEAETIMELARLALLEIVKERKTLTRLREREFKEYMREFMRVEQGEIDEVATTRYWRANIRRNDDA